MKIKKISENVYEIEKEEDMQVSALIFASDELFEKIKQDKTLEQAKNVAKLPGIVKYSLTMPDGHQGYGFPIGGVAAFDVEKGIISPGGVGYDINCGVRLLRTGISKEELMKKREEILKDMFQKIPSGVGHRGALKLSEAELDEVLRKGSQWALEKGYALKEDIEMTEDYGCLKPADASKITEKAKKRGINQLGSIGSGNHFVEIEVIEKIFNKKVADVFGLKENEIVILIHTGSRGLGHQTASDYIQKIEKEYDYIFPDRELIYAPLNSQLGKDYIEAMNAAANFAFANRQIITHNLRKTFERFFPQARIGVVYDIAHNIAKFESFVIDNKKIKVCIHRKGATRSFGPGRKEIPEKYKEIGCPIFIPGSMGTSSYVLVGTNESEKISFSSTAHGAGRAFSRTYAKKHITKNELMSELESKNVKIKAGSIKGMIEEAPEAYKNVDEVVRVSDELNIGKKVAQLKPLAVMKG
ncbi:RtcB family protein [Candidatus Pacearchaeota archaeon]|nr:RtcB family protein [Candidatus Pacearchaeota archaeon]